MISDTVPDIPRLYTAIAEWAACLVYIIILKKRLKGIWLITAIVVFLPVFCALHILAGSLPLVLWIPGMITAIGIMFLYIVICCDITAYDAGWHCAYAFILAEFAASLSWQLFCFFRWTNSNSITPGGIGFTVITYLTVYTVMYFFESRHRPKPERISVSPREFLSVAGITLVIFAVSNLSFVTPKTPFSSRLVPELLYIRTLVDFAGLIILYVHQKQQEEMRLKDELEKIQNVMRRQFEQHEQSKEVIEIINRKYHDIKQQIAVIRAEENSEKRMEYLTEMEKEIKAYEAQNKTGHKVLDTVLMGKSLFCNKHGISLTCIADGALLNFMDVMDICSIFGNALDNAIESVMKLETPEKRVIQLALYSQNDFIMILFENYNESEIRLEGEFPVTMKDNREYHGFGLKSIRYTVEKYRGSLTIHAEDNWFKLRILIPISHDNQ
jgi:thiamine pyrophosphokinase